MPVRIRLQRHGKKGKPFYWIVAADSRSKRDGRYLEKIGTYNPNLNPALIDVNSDSALRWLKNGAVPSDTTRNMLSHLGIMLKHHLNGGVIKGALTQEEADEKFNQWITEKEEKIKSEVDGLNAVKSQTKKKILEAEKAVSDKRISDAAKALLEVSDENTSDNETLVNDEVVVAEETSTTEQTTAAEETPAKETPAKETAAEETPAKETPAKETAAAEETPAKETPAKETAAAEETPVAEETPAVEDTPSKDEVSDK